MKHRRGASLRQGPRPGAIRWFAVLFLAAAGLSLADGLIAAGAPGLLPAMKDAAIVGASARFTIALMTTGLVWFFALRLARWMIPVFLLAKIAMAGVEIARAQSIAFVSPLWAAAMALGVLAAILLFVPGGRRWFDRPEGPSDVTA